MFLTHFLALHAHVNVYMFITDTVSEINTVSEIGCRSPKKHASGCVALKIDAPDSKIMHPGCRVHA